MEQLTVIKLKHTLILNYETDKSIIYTLQDYTACLFRSRAAVLDVDNCHRLRIISDFLSDILINLSYKDF